MNLNLGFVLHCVLVDQPAQWPWWSTGCIYMVINTLIFFAFAVGWWQPISLKSFSLCTCRITSPYMIRLCFSYPSQRSRRGMLGFFPLIFYFYVNVFCSLHVSTINYHMITSPIVSSSVHHLNVTHMYSMCVTYKVNVCKTENRALLIHP